MNTASLTDTNRATASTPVPSLSSAPVCATPSAPVLDPQRMAALLDPSPALVLDPQHIAAVLEAELGELACTLRPDFALALKAASAAEESERGREVLQQLLDNARLAQSRRLPLCQDTGYVWVCLEVSGNVAVPANVFAGVDAAVARAYKTHGLRKSMVCDALLNRSNTGNNTPAFCELLLGSEGAGAPAGHASKQADALAEADGQREDAPVEAGSQREDAPTQPSATLHIMLKGGGSDNASALALLPPGAGLAGVADFVVNQVAAKGANACPPLVVGVGVGGSFDKVAGLSKRALLRTVGSTHPVPKIAELETELLARINKLGIGPGGLGGTTTALAVHMVTAPCHIAALPVAVNIGCSALRSKSIPLL